MGKHRRQKKRDRGGELLIEVLLFFILCKFNFVFFFLVSLLLSPSLPLSFSLLSFSLSLSFFFFSLQPGAIRFGAACGPYEQRPTARAGETAPRSRAAAAQRSSSAPLPARLPPPGASWALDRRAWKTTAQPRLTPRQ